MDGFEAARRIVSEPERNVVLIVAGYGSEEVGAFDARPVQRVSGAQLRDDRTGALDPSRLRIDFQALGAKGCRQP